MRDFALWHMKPGDIAQGFREFRPFLGQCRFRDCSHGDDPGCGDSPPPLPALPPHWIVAKDQISCQHPPRP